MSLIFDAHVHLYPCYNLSKALVKLSTHLTRLGGKATKVAFLAERHDCHFFRELKGHATGESTHPVVPNITVKETGETNALLVTPKGGSSVYLIAGRQIVTSERLEVLSLTIDPDIPDGLPAKTVVERILSAGGIPVISWAPGKWMFGRKAIVESLINEFKPGEIVLGDSTNRPIAWQEPHLMAVAGRRGFACIAGSDPFPLDGEEKYLGTYATFMEKTIDETQPVTSIRGLLRQAGDSFKCMGRRHGVMETAGRIIKNAKEKKNNQTKIPNRQGVTWRMENSICKIPPGTKVLVTGATGFTGIVLTRKLAEAGLKINAIARHSSNLEPLADLDINWFRGDVFDEAVVEAAMKDQAYVFHVAAAFREAKSSEEDYYNVHVKSTELLAKKALENNHFKRFIQISTIGVHGHIEDPGADENYRFSPGDGYQRTKLQAELWLKDFAEETDLPYTIIRPAAIYGPGDLRLLKLFKIARWKFFPLLGKGKCYYHLVHVDDLTNSFIIAATEPKALGEIFISGNQQPIPIAEIAGIVAKTLGGTAQVVRLPIEPFFWAADICEAICRPFNIEPPIYRRRVAFYSKDRMFDTGKLRNVLGYTPIHSNEAGIIETTHWYVSKGWLKPFEK